MSSHHKIMYFALFLLTGSPNLVHANEAAICGTHYVNILAYRASIAQTKDATVQAIKKSPAAKKQLEDMEKTQLKYIQDQLNQATSQMLEAIKKSDGGSITQSNYQTYCNNWILASSCYNVFQTWIPLSKQGKVTIKAMERALKPYSGAMAQATGKPMSDTTGLLTSCKNNFDLFCKDKPAPGSNYPADAKPVCNFPLTMPQQ